MTPNEKNLLHTALLLNRFVLGLLFVFAGLRKVLTHKNVQWSEVNSFGTFFDALKTMFNLKDMGSNWSGFASFSADKAPLPEIIGKLYGYALPPVEFFAGLALMIGLYSRISSTLIALMMLSFIVAMGPSWWPQDGPAFDKNFILLTLAILLAVLGSGKFAFKPDGPLHKK